MITRNRCWRLDARPEGSDFASALSLAEADFPALEDGEIAVENAYLSMDAGTRMWMSPREDSYQPPTPVGSPVQGMVLGVVRGSRHPDYREGDLVRAYGQWADYSRLFPDQVYAARLSWRFDDVRDYVGVFGPNGWTAYLGVTEYGGAAAGETVLVSAAAGATGILAGRIAKAVGARVIGTTGSPRKRDWLLRNAGFDAVIDYRADDVGAALARACPEGIHLYFDNVGGPLLDEVLPNMALFGRVAVCGLIDHYGKAQGAPGPSKYDLVLMKRLKIFGFFSPDFYHRGPDLNLRMTPWRASGAVAVPFDETEGLERTVEAYGKLFNGANLGKVVVKVGELRA